TLTLGVHSVLGLGARGHLGLTAALHETTFTLTHVLGIVYRAISGFILEKAGLTRSDGDTGAVTLIQRFGSALNLNIHFHMLCLDGAFLTGTGPPVFRRIAPPTRRELQALVER